MTQVVPSCPRCNQFLKTVSRAPAHYECLKCRGSFHQYNQLEDRLRFSFLNRVFRLMQEGVGEPSLMCIDCHERMVKIKPFQRYGGLDRYGLVPPAPRGFDPNLSIVVCKSCSGFWLEQHDLLRLPQELEKYDPKNLGFDPLIFNPPMIEGVKVYQYEPKLTYLFMGISILMMLLAKPFPALTWKLALHGNDVFNNLGLHLITSIFVHADWHHLIGNMAFLYVTGKALEHRLSSSRYALLFLGSGIASGLAQSFAEPSGLIVGASGAISGLIGFFPFEMPKAKIAFRFGMGSDLLMGLDEDKISLPAPVVVFAWTLLQYLSGTLFRNENIAYWGHFGGAIAGIIFYFYFLGQDENP